MTGRRVASGERCGDLPGPRITKPARSFRTQRGLPAFLFSVPAPPHPRAQVFRWTPPVTPRGALAPSPASAAIQPPPYPPIPPHSPPFGESKKSKQETYFLCAMQNRHLEHSPVTMVTLCFLNREERRRWRPHWEGSVASGEDPARRVVREKLGTLLVQSACVSVCVGVW